MSQYLRYVVPPSIEQCQKHAETYPSWVPMTPRHFSENKRKEAEEYARQIGSFVIDLLRNSGHKVPCKGNLCQKS